MRKVAWEPAAQEDLREIVRYMIREMPDAAARIEEQIRRAVALLAVRPIGRPGRIAGISEKSVVNTPYIIAYAVTDSELLILRVVHERRDWPSGEWPKTP